MSSNDYSSYGVLAGNVIFALSGTTVVYGMVGSNLPISGTGVIEATDETYTSTEISAAISNAQVDYDGLITLDPETSSSESDIGGHTFTPQIYRFTNPGGLTVGTIVDLNVITLDGEGSYIFQITNGGLTTDTTLGNVSFNLINGAKATQVFWLVNGAINFGDQNGNTTSFVGTIIAQGDITLGTDAKNIGSLVSPGETGTINLNNNFIISGPVQGPRDVTLKTFAHLASSLADAAATTIEATHADGGVELNANSGGLKLRTVSGPFVRTQEEEIALADTDNTVTTAELISQIFVQSPSTNRNFNLPSADDIFTGIEYLRLNDSIDFTIINIGASTITVNGGTFVGDNVVASLTSATFRLRLTNIEEGSRSFKVYRL